MRTPDIKIEHIMQKCGETCVVACLSMVTGKDFERVKSEVTQQKMLIPMIPDAYMDYLVQNDFFPSPVSANSPSPFIFGQLYLVTVASINNIGGLHMVIIDYRGDDVKVYDPNKGTERKALTTDDWNGNGDDGITFPWCDIIELYDCSEK